MFKLTIGKWHTSQHATMAAAVAVFKELRDESANNGERSDKFQVASINEFRLSYNGKVWDNNNVQMNVNVQLVEQGEDFATFSGVIL